MESHTWRACSSGTEGGYSAGVRGGGDVRGHQGGMGSGRSAPAGRRSGYRARQLGNHGRRAGRLLRHRAGGGVQQPGAVRRRPVRAEAVRQWGRDSWRLGTRRGGSLEPARGAGSVPVRGIRGGGAAATFGWDVRAQRRGGGPVLHASSEGEARGGPGLSARVRPRGRAACPRLPRSGAVVHRGARDAGNGGVRCGRDDCACQLGGPPCPRRARRAQRRRESALGSAAHRPAHGREHALGSWSSLGTCGS
mmetsp:Transcript_609/g.1280  ORF Transcript_609/g.1280 Transcript_609/m.1280 type:complete len:250 (-) Transcript_609:217-966(-)